MDDLQINLNNDLFKILELQGDLKKLSYLVQQAQNQINHPDADPEAIGLSIQDIKQTIPKLDLQDIAIIAQEFQEYPTTQIIADMAMFNTQLVDFSNNNEDWLPGEIADEVARLTLNQSLLKVVIDQLFLLKGKFHVGREEFVSSIQHLEKWYKFQFRLLGLVGAEVTFVANQEFLNEEITGKDIAKSNNELTPKSERSRRSVGGSEQKAVFKNTNGGNSRKFSHTPQAKGLDGFSSIAGSKSGLGGMISPKKIGDLSTQPSTQLLSPSLPALNPSFLALNNSPSILSSAIKDPKSPKSALKIKLVDTKSALSRKDSGLSIEPSVKVLSDQKMHASFQLPNIMNITEGKRSEDAVASKKTSEKTSKMPVIPPRYSVMDPTVKMINQMATNCIDLTHESPIELFWRPIIRAPEKKPAENVIKDKLLLKDWEMTQINDFYSYIWDRRILDGEIFRRFKTQGDIIKTCMNMQALSNDLNFWKQENEINMEAQKFVRQMKKLRPYDYFNMKPDVYDMRAQQVSDKGPVAQGGAAKEKDQQKTIEEKGKEEEEDANDANVFNMVGKKEDEVRQAGQLNTAVDAMGQEAAGGGIVFSRGPEVEVAGNKEVENLMQVLSKLNIQLSNKVLQRAMVMPKDREQNAGGYPAVKDSLMHNPFGTVEYKRMEAARKKAEANEKAAAEKAEKAANLKAKKGKKKGANNLEPVAEAPANEEGQPVERHE